MRIKLKSCKNLKSFIPGQRSIFIMVMNRIFAPKATFHMVGSSLEKMYMYPPKDRKGWISLEWSVVIITLKVSAHMKPLMQGKWSTFLSNILSKLIKRRLLYWIMQAYIETQRSEKDDLSGKNEDFFFSTFLLILHTWTLLRRFGESWKESGSDRRIIPVLKTFSMPPIEYWQK